jgi:hypothetical protein
MEHIIVKPRILRKINHKNKRIQKYILCNHEHIYHPFKNLQLFLTSYDSKAYER